MTDINEDIVIDDTLNITEDADTIELDEQVEEVDVEQLKATNAKLYERAKKAETELKKFKPQINKPEGSKSESEYDKRIAQLELSETKRQFGFEHGLSPAETDAIFKINPRPTKEDLDNPFVKGGIEALRKKARVENNTPSPSSSAPKFNGKSFDELDEAGKKANWAKMIEAKVQQKKG